MAKSAYDAALLLSILSGKDTLDNKSKNLVLPYWYYIASEIPSDVPTDYTQFTKNATFHGLRLGIPRKFFFNATYVGSQEIIDAADDAIEKMRSLGAFIQDPADLPTIEELIASYSEAFVMRICPSLLPNKQLRISKSTLRNTCKN
jgi:Asp-tRNA(Asn)/Glu-tRNA(Gln) amidotransferase A subunit family amidase